MKALKKLTLDKITLFDSNIEKAWEKALLANDSIVEFRISNFSNAYAHGEHIFMGLKRRKRRLEVFEINNSTLYDTHLYYFTAFVRRNNQFNKFSITGDAFEELKDNKGIPVQNN